VNYPANDNQRIAMKWKQDLERRIEERDRITDGRRSTDEWRAPIAAIRSSDIGAVPRASMRHTTRSEVLQ
jgi:hypothetical protein